MKEIRVAVCECFSPLMGLDGVTFSMADFAGEYHWPFKSNTIIIEDTDPRTFFVTTFPMSAPEHDYVASPYPCQLYIDVSPLDNKPFILSTGISVPGCAWVNSVFWDVGSEDSVVDNALLQIVLQIARVESLDAKTASALVNSFEDLS